MKIHSMRVEWRRVPNSFIAVIYSERHTHKTVVNILHAGHDADEKTGILMSGSFLSNVLTLRL